MVMGNSVRYHTRTKKPAGDLGRQELYEKTAVKVESYARAVYPIYVPKLIHLGILYG